MIMTQFVKIDDDQHLVRDAESMLISNTNSAEKQAYYNRKNIIKKQNQRLNDLEKSVNDIKSMIQTLLDKAK